MLLIKKMMKQLDKALTKDDEFIESAVSWMKELRQDVDVKPIKKFTQKFLQSSIEMYAGELAKKAVISIFQYPDRENAELIPLPAKKRPRKISEKRFKAAVLEVLRRQEVWGVLEKKYVDELEQLVPRLGLDPEKSNDILVDAVDNAVTKIYGREVKFSDIIASKVLRTNI